MALFGGLAAPRAQAQAPSLPAPTTTDRAALLAEQRQPQQEVPFNPADFSKFEGYYQYRHGSAFFHIFRTEGHYFSQITGQPAVDIFPESPTEFFATVVPAQISFDIGADGRVTQLVLHQNGYLRPWARSTKAANDAAEAALQQRVKDNKPSPGTEAAIHRQIESIERSGKALYAEMGLELAESAHDQSAQSAALFKRLGAFESLRFYKVLPDGRDDYLATFASGKLEVTVSPLSPDGKILGLFYHDVP
jgi:hypothetical protein